MQELDKRVANLEQKLEFAVTRDELAEVIKSLHLRFDRIETRFDGLETRIDGLETRIGTLETRFDALETRIDALETRFDALESRFDKLESRFDKLENRVEANGLRLDSLTSQFESFREEQRIANEAQGKAWEKLDGQMTMAESDREQLFNRLDAIQTALENRGISVD